MHLHLAVANMTSGRRRVSSKRSVLLGHMSARCFTSRILFVQKLEHDLAFVEDLHLVCRAERDARARTCEKHQNKPSNPAGVIAISVLVPAQVSSPSENDGGRDFTD